MHGELVGSVEDELRRQKTMWRDLHNAAHADWAREKERAERAIMWLRLHRWVVIPGAVCAGILIGQLV